MPESNQAKLRRRYPTMESFNVALKAAGSKKALASQLCMSPSQVTYHYKCLKNGSPLEIVRPDPGINNCDFTDKEIDKRVREIYGNKLCEVKVYKLTDSYVPGQIGNEGLEFIRTDVSRASVNYWERRSVKA